MTFEKNLNGAELYVKVIGRLDTATAPDFVKEINDELTGIESLVLDFSGLEYISSAGLRVLLQAQKTMNKQGKMVVKNANDMISEVFEITGFIDILNIE